MSVPAHPRTLDLAQVRSGHVHNSIETLRAKNTSGSPTRFADVSCPVIISAPGDTFTNLVLAGEATHPAARYYRVRVAP